MRSPAHSALVLAISGLVIITLSSVGSGQEPAVRDLLIEGTALTAEAVKALEAKVAADPNDLADRIRLLGYYMMHREASEEVRKACNEHVHWFIRHHPEHPILARPWDIDPVSDAEFYSEARRLWLEHCAKEGVSTAVLANAGTFLMKTDKAQADEFLRRAKEAETNPDRLWQMGRVYYMQGIRQGEAEEHPELMKLALTYYDRALELMTGTDRIDALDDMGKTAVMAGDYEKAKRYATELLQLAVEVNPSDWHYGNAVHHGNLVLGHVALQDGDIAKAEEFLLKAGQTPGSPQLNSFGPNMLLAKRLLEKDRKPAVIEYLRACGKFWKGAKVDGWIKDIEEGRMPDFGANLIY